MDSTYLHRLSRPPRPDASDGDEATVQPSELRVVETTVPPSAGAPRSRRRPAANCEVCGRTLLTGERATAIVIGDAVVEACPLCVIQAQVDARRSAA